MTQDNDAALPPVDVAGLVQSLRAQYECGLMSVPVGHKYVSFGEAATALERLARERDEAREIIRLAATDYLGTKDKMQSEPFVREKLPRMLADLAETGEWMRKYVGDRDGALAELADRLKTAERERNEAKEMWCVEHDDHKRAVARAEAAQERIAALEGALEPFATLGRLIDTSFGPGLGVSDGAPFQSGMAWQQNGVSRTITWGDFRRARDCAALARKGDDGWLPIESAPKDGSPVDLWAQSIGLLSRDSDELRPYIEFRVPDAIWFQGNWTDRDGNPHPYFYEFTNLVFTHWRPLPPPPEKGGE